MSKRIIANIIKYIILLIIYVILLTLVCSIPKNYIYSNTKESAEQLIEAGEKTIIKSITKNIVLFNFTDAIMLNTIYSIDEENPFESAMLARRNYVKDKTTVVYKDTNPPGEETAGSANYVSETYQTKELYETVNSRDTYDCIEYARYWHGYIVILRPLLIIFNYNQLQIISAITFFIITLVFLYLLKKKIGTKEALAFLIGFIIGDIFICSISLNAIIPFYISVISGIYFLCKKDKGKSNSFAFLIIGSLTSFFDLLTTPLVTLAIPLLVKIMLDVKENKNILKDQIYNIISWGIGYATTLIFKWIVTDIFLNREVIITSIKQFLYRIGNEADGIKYTFGLTMERNLYFLGTLHSYILIILCIITLVYIIRNKNFNRNSIAILIISLLPIFWYMFLKNHSSVHAFFTYRNMVITIIAILIIFLNNINFYNITNKFKEKQLILKQKFKEKTKE